MASRLLGTAHALRLPGVRTATWVGEADQELEPFNAISDLGFVGFPGRIRALNSLDRPDCDFDRHGIHRHAHQVLHQGADINA